jgi:hypothetical protein
LHRRCSFARRGNRRRGCPAVAALS